MRLIRHLCCQCGMEECGAYREYCDECFLRPPIGVMVPADRAEPSNPSYAGRTRGDLAVQQAKRDAQALIKEHYARVIDKIWDDAIENGGT